MCEAFLSSLQCCVRIYGSLMGLTQSLEKIYITAFIRVCLGEFFVRLPALLDSEFTEEWDNVLFIFVIPEFPHCLEQRTPTSFVR